MTMRKIIFILTGVFLVFSSSLFGSISPSEWDYYCRKCHIDRPVNSLYDAEILAHKNTSRSCVSCHRDKGFSGHVKRSAESFFLLFRNSTLPPDIKPPKASSVKSEECLTCHSYIWEVDEIEQRKLPKAVRPMMLRAAHSQHWDYRTFTPELRDQLKTLMAKKAKFALSKTEQDQLDRLLQIEKMQCSRCHERFKQNSPGGVDPNVNIAMKNPKECTSCHVALRAAVHPGDTSPLPSAVSCERCHYGKLHQKMVFFPVDYGTEADCLKCHQKYSPEELRAVKPDQFTHKSTAALNQRLAKKSAESGYSNITKTGKTSGAVDSTPIPIPTPIKKK
jgi:hypothetical protein